MQSSVSRLRPHTSREVWSVDYAQPDWHFTAAALLDEGPGFAVLDGVPVEGSLMEAKRSAFNIGYKLGQPQWQDDMGTLVWTVENTQSHFYDDTRSIASEVAKSSKSNDALPPHCDGAVRWLGQQVDAVVLLAYKTSVGGDSILVDSEDVFRTLMAEDPSAALRLMQPMPFGRATGRLREQRSVTSQAMFSWENDCFRARINTQRVRATLRELEIVDLELQAALDVVDEIVQEPKRELRLHLEPGQCLITNDRRIAHARDAFPATIERIMLRVWLHRPPSGQQQRTSPIEMT